MNADSSPPSHESGSPRSTPGPPHAASDPDRFSRAPRQPDPADPNVRRWTTRPLPAYRFVPGQTPHPRNDPRGHSHGAPEPECGPWRPEEWRTNELWLWGVDCFNLAYWWESHEALEALWLAAGRTSAPAQFVQGVIQIAAAHLKRFAGTPDGGRSLVDAGLARLEGFSGTYLGVDVAAFVAEVRESFAGSGSRPATIRLREP